MKENRPIIFLFIAVLLTFFCSCRKPGCLGGSGSMIVQERTIPPFSKIELNDNIDLHLIQDSTNKIEITAPENILPNIQTNVTDDFLTISNTTECRWLRDPDEKIKIKLHLKDLTLFEYKGSGIVTNEDTLRMGSIWFNSETGAGIIDLKVNVGSLGAILLKENASMIFRGNARHCDTYTNARGLLDLSELNTKSMYIIYSGLADTHINVSEGIEAYIRYKGNVYCKGNPTIVKQEYFSSGKLIITP